MKPVHPTANHAEGNPDGNSRVRTASCGRGAKDPCRQKWCAAVIVRLFTLFVHFTVPYNQRFLKCVVLHVRSPQTKESFYPFNVFSIKFENFDQPALAMLHLDRQIENGNLVWMAACVMGTTAWSHPKWKTESWNFFV